MGPHHLTSSSPCYHDGQCLHPLTQSPGKGRKEGKGLCCKPWGREDSSSWDTTLSSPPPHSTFSRKTGRGQEDGDLSRVYAVLASFLEKMSLRGQLLATPQTRATFSSHCRLSGKLGGRANLDKPLPWSLRECLSCAPSRTVHHLSGGSQGRRERGSL